MSFRRWLRAFFAKTPSIRSAKSRHRPLLDTLETRLAPAGDFAYAVAFGSPSEIRGNAIASDSAGNVYVAGHFKDDAQFGALSLTTSGQSAFVAKYSPTGTALWAIKLDSTGDDTPHAIAVDGSGNVFVTGSFAGQNFAGDPNLDTAGSSDVFVAKLSASSGSLTWANRYGAGNADVARGIALDGSGNIYLTGQFFDTTNFGAGNVFLHQNGNNDGFVVRLNPAGALSASRFFGSASSGEDIGRAIAVSAAGNVFVAGAFVATSSFGSSTATANGGRDGFVWKLSSDLQTSAWVRSFDNGGADEIAGMTLDAAGNPIVSGTWSGSIDDNPPQNFARGFVAKLTDSGSSGNVSWTTVLGSDGGSVGAGVSLDSAGNVYATGRFDGGSFPAGGSTTLASVNNHDAFVSSLDSSGIVQWTRQLGGTADTRGRGIAVDSSGNIFTTGQFNGSGDFDPGTGTTTLTETASSYGGYLSKLVREAPPTVASTSPSLKAGTVSAGATSVTVAFSEPMPFTNAVAAIPLGSASNPAYSPKQILSAIPGAPSGVYWFDSDGSGPNAPFQAYADMTTDGGGWMLVVNSVINSEAPSNEIIANTGTVSLSSGHTRNAAYLAHSQSAQIRHDINAVNVGLGTLHRKYVGTYGGMPTSGSWTGLSGDSNPSLLGASYGFSLQGTAFGSPWYHNGSSFFTAIPASPASGGQPGPAVNNSFSSVANSYRIWVREVAAPPAVLPEIPGTPGTGAGNPANYELRRAGVDGLLGTADDVTVSTSVNYSGTTATISFAALSAGEGYRLTVKDTLTDVANVALDGDADGTPGGSYVKNFVAGPNVLGWGHGGMGQIGYGGFNTHNTAPLAAAGASDFVALAGQWGHTLALKADGTVWAWGRNDYGQIGASNSSVPIQVAGLTGVIAIAAGELHSVALKSDGTVWTWGGNFYGQLGIGFVSNGFFPIPNQVPGLTGVTAIGAGYSHSLAVLANGTVRSWGLNNYGQLGNGSTSTNPSPTPVSGLSGVTQVAGGAYHTLALLSNGTVRGWGYNFEGQLGDTTFSAPRLTPVAVNGLTGVTQVEAGQFHSLALLSDGTVRSWGFGAYGQLGNGSSSNSAVPVAINGLSEVARIEGGFMHSLALRRDGTVRAWGYNEFGQLGDGTTFNRYLPVVSASGLGSFSAIAGVAHTTIAIRQPLVAASVLSGVTGPANGSYNAGDSLSFTANFSAPVAVTGSPRLALNIGGATRYASYASGSGTSALTFTYIVAAGDTDTDGIQAISPIDLNGGSISGVSSLAFTPPNTSGVLVDTTSPTVVSFTRASANPTSAATVDYTLVFSEPVTGLTTTDIFANASAGLTGTVATAISGSGTTYTVTFSTGIGSGSFDVQLQAGAVADAAGNALAAAANGPSYTVERSTAAIVGNDFVLTDAGNRNESFTISFDAATNTYAVSNTSVISVVLIPGATGSGTNTVTIPAAALAGQFIVNGSGGDDTLTVDFSGGMLPDIVFDGGAGGNDALTVIGNGSTDAKYSPASSSTASNKQGTVQVVGSGTTNISFSNLEPVNITGMSTASLTSVSLTPLVAGNSFTIANGTQSGNPGQAAIVVSGTTNNGGTPIETVHFYNNTTVQIDTSGIASSTDTFTIAGADATAAGITNLTFNTGSEAGDSIAISGTATVAGTLSLITGGAATQSAPIVAPTLILGSVGNAGAYTLTNSSNTIGSLTATTTANAAVADSAGGLALAGGNVGGTYTLTANGGLSQIASVTAGTLSATNNSAGSIALNSFANPINSFSATNNAAGGAANIQFASGGTVAGITTSNGSVNISNAAGSVLNLGGNISTSGGSVAFASNSASVDLTAAGISVATGGGSLTVSRPINADGAANNRTLSIAAGAGTVTLGGVGGSRNLQSLAIVSSGTGSAVGAVTTRSGGILIASSGMTLNGDLRSDALTTAGAISLSGAYTLGAAVSIDSDAATTDASITFATASSVSGANSLTLNSGGANIGLNNTTFGTPTPLSTLSFTAADVSGTGSIASTGLITVTNTGTASALGGVISSGSVTKSGVGTLTLSGNSSYSGGTTVSQGTLLISHASGAGSGAVTLNDVSTGTNNTNFQATGAFTVANAIVVSNNGTGISTIGTTSFNPGAAATIFSNSITLNKAATFFGGNTDRTTYTGAVSGAGAITISGPGIGGGPGTVNRTTFQNNSNSFTGNISIVGSNTQFQLDGATVVPDSVSIDVAAGNFLLFNTASETINALTGAGTVQKHPSVGGLTILTIGSAGGSGTFSGLIANGGGTIAITKTGGGTQTIAGSGSTDNTASGLLRVSNGTLIVGSGFTGDGAWKGNVTIDGGATLQLTQSNIFANGSDWTINGTFNMNGMSDVIGNLAGSGAITNNAGLNLDDLAANASYSGSISGTGGLVLRAQVTGGTQTFSGTVGVSSLGVGQSTTNTATLAVTGGAITVSGELLVGDASNSAGIVNHSAGTLQINNRVRLGHWAGKVSTYNLSGAASLGVFNALNVGWDGIGVFAMTGGTASVGSVEVDASSVTTAISGQDDQLTVSGGTLTVGSGSGVLAVARTGNATVGGGVGTATVNAGTFSIASAASGASATFQANAAVNVQSIYVGDASGASGSATQSGGTVTVSGQVRIGHYPNNTSSYAISGGSLSLTGTSGSNPFGGGEFNGAIYLGIDGTGTFTQSGGTVSAQGLILDNRGDTAGTDTYTLTNGSLTLGQWGIQANASTQINLEGGSVIASAAWNSSRPMTLTSNASPVTFNTNGFNVGLSGNLSGVGSLTKSSSGTLTLSGTNAYTGITTVNAGTLLVNGSLANGTAGDDVVVTGGILGGSGTVNGAIRVDSGSLAPGNSPGILNSGSVSFRGGSFAVEINGTTVGAQYDQLNVSGTVALGGGVATLNLSGSFVPVVGNSFVVINNDGFDNTTGYFAGLPEGAAITFGGVPLYLTYNGGDGNDVVLNTTPVINGTAGADTFVFRQVAGVPDRFEVSVNSGPFADLGFVNSATINGLDGNDTLTLDYSNGAAIPTGGLTFNGGGQTGLPGDKLVVQGGAFANFVSNYTNANDGSLSFDGRSVTYTGLEPILVNAGSIANAVFNLPSSGSVATLGDDGTLPNGLIRISSSPATFENTVFTAPTGSLTINRGNAADTLSLGDLSDFVNSASLTLGAAGASFSSISFGGTLAGASLSAFGDSMSNTAPANVDIANNASFSGTTITLGGVGGDDFSFGSLTFASGGAVAIAEDSATSLVGANSASSLSLTSAGALTSDGTASVAVTNNASFSAASITLGNVGGSFDFGSLTFASAGAVGISEDSATSLSGTSNADSLSLISSGALTNAASASLTVTNNATLQGISVDLGNAAGDAMNFGSLTSVATSTSIAIAEDSATALNNLTAVTTVTLQSGGAVTDNNAGAVNVSGTTFVVSAAGGIDLDTTIADLTATASAAGSILIDESDSIALTSVTTADGSITVTAGGTVTATSVVSSTDATNVIALTTTVGDILVDLVSAVGDTIDLNAAGSIEEVGASDAASDLTASVINLSATTGIGGLATIEIDGNTIANRGLTASVTGTGSIQLLDVNGLRVRSATTANGDIIIAAASGDLTLETLTAGSVGNTANLSATGAITDGNGAALNITATNLILKAATGIGAGTGTAFADELETAVANADASNTASGGIYLKNSGALTLKDLDAPADGLGLVSIGGGRVEATSPITVSSNQTIVASMTFVAGNSASPTDTVTFDSNAVVAFNAGGGATLRYEAGDSILFNTGSIATTGTATVQLLADQEAGLDALRGVVTQTGAINSVASTSGTVDLQIVGVEVGTSNATPFRFEADTLQVDTSAGDATANRTRNQWLFEADTIAVNALAGGGLNAGLGQTLPLRGHIFLVGGSFVLAAGDGIQDQSAVRMIGAASLDLNNDSETIGSLSSPLGTAASVVFGTGSLTTGGNNLSTTWNSGTLGGGSGGLIKSGSGSFRLGSGASYTFTGAIDHNAGALVVNGALASSANAITVAAGAILGGTGTLNRPLVVQGTLSPGDSGLEIADPTTVAAASLPGPVIGVLSTGTGSTVQFDATATFLVDLTLGFPPVASAQFDQLKTDAAVTIANGATLLVNTPIVPSQAANVGTSFRLIDNGLGSAISGKFAVPADLTPALPHPEIDAIKRIVVGGVYYEELYNAEDGQPIALASPGANDLTLRIDQNNVPVVTTQVTSYGPVLEDGLGFTIVLSAKDTETANGSLTFFIDTLPNAGMLYFDDPSTPAADPRPLCDTGAFTGSQLGSALVGGVNVATLTLTYVPGGNVSPIPSPSYLDTFGYTVRDAGGLNGDAARSASAAINVTLTPSNIPDNTLFIRSEPTGNVLFVTGSGASDIIKATGGGATFTVTRSAYTYVITDLGGGSFQLSTKYGAGTPVITALAGGAGPITEVRMFGRAGADTLNGSALSVRTSLFGGAGNDILRGGSVIDVLFGGSEVDNLYGSAGDDVMFGGAGNDTLWGDANNDCMHGGEGSDSLWGGIGDDELSGAAGVDYLYGEGGNDTIDGGAENDVLRGADGDDILHGGAGIDSIYGGLGNDTFQAFSNQAESDTFAGEGGIETLEAIAGSPLVLSAFQPLNGIKIVLGNGMEIWGGAGRNTLDFSAVTNMIAVAAIDGRDGDDVITGNDQPNVIRGGNGNDYLYGRGSNDVLVGDAGVDVIDGGAGDDTLWGGSIGMPDASADYFSYTSTSLPGSDSDDIRDFTDGIDRIDLRPYSPSTSLVLQKPAVLPGVPAPGIVFAVTDTVTPADIILLLPNGKKIRVRNLAIANLSAADFINVV